jgi:agmatinase
MMHTLSLLAFIFAALLVPVASHKQNKHFEQTPLAKVNSESKENPPDNEWLAKYGPQIDQVFSGPLSFSHLPYARCLEDSSARFDIALLGMPFDTGVSYRPGARFGPYGIRSGSRRQRETRGWTLSWQTNPYAQGSRIIDCGDVSPMVNPILLPCF